MHIYALVNHKILNSKRAEITRKIKESEFLNNIGIYPLCPKYLQSFNKFLVVVTEELHFETVHYYMYIQNKTKILRSKGAEIPMKIKESDCFCI